MKSWSKRVPLLGFLGLLGFWVNACGSDANDSDDDDDGGEGSVLGGSSGTGTGGTGTGGSKPSGGAGGSDAAGSGGSASPGTGGTGGTDAAGNGGTGAAGTGSGGTAGTGTGTAGSNSAGSGGMSGGPALENIGAPCDSDSDCGTDFVCITSESTTFGPGGPAHGMCTVACADETDCGTDAICVLFDEEQSLAYCIESCEFGVAGEPKCHERVDFSCTILDLINHSGACETSDECGTDQLCDTRNSMCGDILPACLPTCGGDYDCESGQSCDFVTGLCIEGTPEGDPIGTLCDPQAETDPCNGFCIQANDEGTEGLCTALCTLSPTLVGCGWDGTGVADAACLFAAVTPAEGDPGDGDVGICGTLCDCNDDCAATLDRCVDETGGAILDVFGRNGYCRPLDTGETEDDTFATCE